MKASRPISRRALMKASLGAAALAASAALPAATPTPQQTEGPFFPSKDQADKDLDMTRIEGHSERAEGEVVEVEGQVVDVDGAPIAGALVDVWQANAKGRYAHERDPNPAPLDPHFQGWARLTTDAEGRFRVRTIKPGAYPVGEGWSRPPHIHYKVARRGFHELTTQMYFAGDPLNDIDRVLGAVPEAQRGSLIVDFAPAGQGGVPTGSFVMVLRTV
ncbi:protocatechuate 3,4-dioxygenase [Pseudomarimonas salicorniae]|uniref:Protocatechuate 3,4-dioxygenase n=1 Tax=Pseudomarimonas salicorniae TaxID=2933270 RepID=A0ABT0GDV6_9GAMM|nr:protocatechuate 3,4-dioxygenase [Lysobacter sp. CAU 1642]MCK7592718.1 protocatechuate 3,4-dioxygenase [Lysobacter sp. CAU 1642]